MAKPEIDPETGATIVRSGYLCKTCGSWVGVEACGTYCKDKDKNPVNARQKVRK